MSHLIFTMDQQGPQRGRTDLQLGREGSVVRVRFILHMLTQFSMIHIHPWEG